MNHDPHGLVAAAQANDLRGIRTAARDGATMLDTDAQGHTALWYAAEGGHTHTAQTLLDALPVSDLTAEQAHISACAEHAAERGHAKTLEVLSDTGAVNEPARLRIAEVATGDARAWVDQAPTFRTPSSLDLADMKTAEVRENFRQQAWHDQQAGITVMTM
ncbi:MAG: hypothetical protein KGI42_03285 [Xanthomonadaceae bacterium]|nr:hypothetical protein [Xanthomonadaceae bacterium]